MRLLLTRAAADSARTRTALEALGHRVLVSPMIVVEPTGAPWPGGVVDAVLATSGQAFAALTDDAGPPPEARRLLPLWLVGSRTEAVARQHGFLGASVVAQNAVSLTLEMAKRRSPGRIVYLAGRDRKPDIETALLVTGQVVETIEVYVAKAAAGLDLQITSALETGAIDGVLHFSRRSATLFTQFASAISAANVTHFCLSDDVAEPLRASEQRIVVAKEPTEPSLISALELWLTAT